MESSESGLRLNLIRAMGLGLLLSYLRSQNRQQHQSDRNRRQSHAAVQRNGPNTGWRVRRPVLRGPALVSRPGLAAALAVLPWAGDFSSLDIRSHSCKMSHLNQVISTFPSSSMEKEGNQHLLNVLHAPDTIRAKLPWRAYDSITHGSQVYVEELWNQIDVDWHSRSISYQQCNFQPVS